MWDSCNKWFFERGPTDGFNDSGISNFKDMKYDGLAREIIQNSLDAKDPSCEEPVKVIFEKKIFDINLFPGLSSFYNTVGKCIDFISTQSSNSGIDSLNDIKKHLDDYEKNGKFPVLVVSDCNTTGLDGYKKSSGSSWSDLLKIHGNNNKSSSSGGSYGIGKFAPFVFSSLRTIIYSSKNRNEGIAVQGKTILSGHIDGCRRTPRGYFGELSSIKIDDVYEYESFPFLTEDSIPNEYVKKEYGTSLYILGANFNLEWFDEITLAVIVSFFYAILSNQLTVVIKDGEHVISINNESIKDIMNNYYKKFSKRKDFLQTLSFVNVLTNKDGVKTFSKKFSLLNGEVGEMTLKLICDDSIISKSIAHVRKSGMKIENCKNFRTIINYSGVCVSSNKNMNDFLRRCEPPKHDNWKAENFAPLEEEKNVKKILGEIYDWERDCVNSLVSINTIEKIDPIGMEKFLSYDIDVSNSNSEMEDVLNMFKPLRPVLKKESSLIKIKKDENNGVSLEENFDAYAKEKSNNKNKDKGDHLKTGKLNEKEGNKKVKQKVMIKDIKTPYLYEKGKYLITFTSCQTVNNCYLEIKRASDDSLESLSYNNLELYLDNKFVQINDFNLNEDEKYILRISFNNVDREVLEVNCYAKE